MSIREFDLIDRYFSGISPDDDTVSCGIGDDTAIINIPDGQEMLVAVDTLVSDVHFLATADAHDIGYKSLAVNISDIAAMGGRPRWATLALTLPGIDPDWLQTFATGFAEIASKYSVTLVGGDTTQGPLSITVQIMGTVIRGQSIRRNGAKPGDLIFVSGYLGAAGFAYRTLNENTASQDISPYCLQRLHRPEPRVELGRQLCKLASASIDVSDGLAADLNHILKSSGVAAEVQLAGLPLCDQLEDFDDKILLWQIALASGDDYELCFTISADKKEELEKRTRDLGYPVTYIGNITTGEGINWLEENGEEVILDLEGYQHF